MVEQNIGAPRRIGAGIVADHGVETEGGFHRFALEPAVEEGPRRLGEQFEYIALLRQAELGQPAPLPDCVDQRLEAVANIGRRFEREVAEHIGHALEHLIIFGKARGVMRREAGKFLLRTFEPAAELQIAAIFLRQKIADRSLDHPITVIGELHVGNDLRLQQADRIACDRISETRRKFFGHRSAADNVARFDDTDLQPCLREVECTDEAIVAGANNQGVIGFGHGKSFASGD